MLHGMVAEEQSALLMQNTLILLFQEVVSLPATLLSAPRKQRRTFGNGGFVSHASVDQRLVPSCASEKALLRVMEKDIEDLKDKNSSLND